MEFKDYYKILGVDRNASQEDIKAAYRKLARKYHPDLNKGNKEYEAKLKEINEAYEVLGDPQKRARYDSLGANWEEEARRRAQAQGGFAQFSFGGAFDDFSDFFKVFFGDLGQFVSHSRFDDFTSFFGQRPQEASWQDVFTSRKAGAGKSTSWEQAGPREVPEQEIEISLEEACRGAEKVVQLAEGITCRSCAGQGTRYGSICPACQGKGRVYHHQRVAVKIPAGVRDGTKIRVPSASGDEGGDFYLQVKLKPHPLFTVEGDNLVCELPVSLFEALLGTEVTIPTPGGGKVAVKVPPETQNGQVLRLRGLGLPGLHNTHRRGDLLVRTKVVLPTGLSPREKELYQELASLRRENPRGNWPGRQAS